MKSIINSRNHSFLRCSLLFLLAFICFSRLLSTQDAENRNDQGSKISAQQDETASWKKQAKKMVETQLIDRGITDKNVLRAMEITPRHLFLPKSYIEFGYYDGPMSIGEGQTISQPYIVAIMTELLKLKGHEKVLEIGTGSGYQAAILSQLVDTCYSVELIKSLADRAAKLLHDQEYHNVVVKCDDGYKGWVEHAPFDAIIITAAPEEIPPRLVEQLKVNGRMVLPVGKSYQQLMLITKTDKGIKKKNIFPVSFVPMVKPK